MTAPVSTRPALSEDAPAMATLAARHQAVPESHNPYLPIDATSIQADIRGLERWVDTAVVAEREGDIVGWLLGETDIDMGRVWWWGPFAPDDGWDNVSDSLHRAATRLLPSAISEYEGCGDERNVRLAAWCRRHGMEPEEASVLLELTDPRAVDAGEEMAAAVRPMAPADHDRVRDLHARYFPDTHVSPDALVSDTNSPRFVVELESDVRGYVAVEMHSDGSGYIDFVAVDELARGRGLGRELVRYACADLFGRGATFVHLTVRESNRAARSLYASLAFVETRLARPFRMGFTLA